MALTCTSVHRAKTHARYVIALAAIAAAAAPSHAMSAEPAAPDQPIVAIWRIHRIEFSWSSARVFYSCDALQSKIGALLRAVGAHPQVFVDPDCQERGFVNHALIRTTFAAPTLATEEAVREAMTFDSREQLIARVHSLQLPAHREVRRFPAEWRSISLSRNNALQLGPGDCDLVRAIRQHVFPSLAVRVDREWRCNFTEGTRIKQRFEVTALMPALPEENG
jgi:hypothetical protein